MFLNEYTFVSENENGNKKTNHFGAKEEIKRMTGYKY